MPSSRREGGDAECQVKDKPAIPRTCADLGLCGLTFPACSAEGSRAAADGGDCPREELHRPARFVLVEAMAEDGAAGEIKVKRALPDSSSAGLVRLELGVSCSLFALELARRLSLI